MAEPQDYSRFAAAAGKKKEIQSPTRRKENLPPTPVVAVWLHPSTPADSSKITHVGGVAEWAE